MANMQPGVFPPLRHNGTLYRGMNILLLWAYAGPTWMTFKQTLNLTLISATGTRTERRAREIANLGHALAQKVIYQRHERLAVKRFSEEAIRAFVQIEGFRSGGRLSSDDDHRYLAAVAFDIVEKFQASHLPVPHLDIRDNAVALGQSIGCQERLYGGVRLRAVSV
jgi:hypothetical protein